METPGLEVRRRRGHALPGAVGVADFEPMLQTPPLVIDAEDDHEGRRILRDANLVGAQVILQVEPDHALAVRMSLPLNLRSHAPPFASPCVTHGAVRGCVRGALPGCASPVLAIGGAHLLSVPRSRAGPVDAAQSDRVPEMPSRRLVASALIRPMVKLRVRSLCRRHLHPYPCRLPSRSEPARCRLIHDFAHTTSRGEALAPLAPGRASAARCGRTTRSRVRARPFRGDASDRRATRGWRGRSARPRRSPAASQDILHPARCNCNTPKSGSPAQTPQAAIRFAFNRSCRALTRAAARSMTTASPLPKYISSGV